ncbi:MAG TPA: CRISPR-associated protein Cas4 [Pyrinomonadaceae bacterium]|nr:CRISPR-associated protein Cas4 [Pyrinomonadaceae bacterium]
MPTESEPVLISALNEYVFCPRRCALKYVEGYWADNEHTAVGTLLHDHADAPGYETDAGVTILRAVPLFSERYGLSGKADIVEVRKVNFELRIADCEMKDAGEGEAQRAKSKARRTKGGTEEGPVANKAGFVSTTCGSGWAGATAQRSEGEGEDVSVSGKSAIRIPKSEILYAPVEYKKGKRRKWDNDDVQLCAQAFCLEEMFSVTVAEGFIYHAGSKRRRKVSFDESLRSETSQTIEAVRALIANREVPPAVLKPRCDGCSLRSVCLPELTQIAARAKVDDYGKNLWT